jgi:hypothetical protein
VVANAEAKAVVADAAVKAEAKAVVVADVKVDREVRLRFTGQMFLPTPMTS